MSSLSPKALQVYRFIHNQELSEQKPPSINEIAKEVGVSTRTALELLRDLEDSLVIKRSPYKSRSIEIIAEVNSKTGEVKEELVEVPIIGTAPGGPMLIAEENFEGVLNIPHRLIRGYRNVFLLRVVGESMSPYLDDGDLALVKQESIHNVNNGDYVVAVVESESYDGWEATIKEFNRSGKQVILNPLNRKKYQPIVNTIEKIGVQGKVIGAIKLNLG